jgi:hypothetical protein
MDVSSAWTSRKHFGKLADPRMRRRRRHRLVDIIVVAICAVCVRPITFLTDIGLISAKEVGHVHLAPDGPAVA